MRNMYDITNELDELREVAFNEAEENDGVISDYLEDMITSIEGEYEDKAEQLACLYKDVLAFSNTIKSEKARLDKLKKTYDNEAKRIKEYLSAFIASGEKIKTPKMSISWRKSTKTVLKDGVDVNDIPSEYHKVKIEADKTAILAAIKSGVDGVDDFAEVVVSNNIQIK